MNIYLLAVTNDDGRTWNTLSSVGYFATKEEAQRECDKRNQSGAEFCGELTRWEIRTSKPFVFRAPAACPKCWNVTTFKPSLVIRNKTICGSEGTISPGGEAVLDARAMKCCRCGYTVAQNHAGLWNPA